MSLLNQISPNLTSLRDLNYTNLWRDLYDKRYFTSVPQSLPHQICLALNNNSFTDCTHYRPTIEGLAALGALITHTYTHRHTLPFAQIYLTHGLLLSHSIHSSMLILLKTYASLNNM